MSLLEDANKFFEGDLYAREQTGIVIEEVDIGHAVCSFEIKPHHRNADGVVMGGAIYTLADFTFAVAANANSVHTVTLDGQVNYLAIAKGDKLTATARCIRSGRTICTFDVLVSDGERNIAHAVFNGFRKQK